MSKKKKKSSINLGFKQYLKDTNPVNINSKVTKSRTYSLLANADLTGFVEEDDKPIRCFSQFAAFRNYVLSQAFNPVTKLFALKGGF